MEPSHNSQQRIGDFYTDVVLPALADRLDSAFPEFGWKRDSRGWVATNEEMTHRVLGARADRVVAQGLRLAGFLVHGGDAMLWTAYLNSGFVPAAKRSRRSFGRSPSGQEWRPHRSTDHDHATAEPTSSRASPHSVARSCAGTRELRRGRTWRDADYPPARSIMPDLGVVPRELFTKNALEAAGYSELEIAQSGVLADGRWPGRLCGAWRDERGKVRTLWARSLKDSDSSSRYLYLTGASRSGLPPYGLSDVLRLPPSERSELLLVEGLMDVHHLHAKGLPNVAAVGGARLSSDLIPRIGRLGFDTIVLAFDNDAAGREGISRAVESASRAKEAPTLRVLEPKRLGESKDPDAFVREHGIEKFRALIDHADCAISWHALELTRGVTPQHDTPLASGRPRQSRQLARDPACPTLAGTRGRSPPRRRPVRLLANLRSNGRSALDSGMAGNAKVVPDW